MEFAIQRCCTTPIFLKQYETSTDAVLNKFGVKIVDIKEFNCCGYPLKNFNFKAHILSSARNLALAERRGLNIMTICNCCYGSLKHVNHLMKEETSIRDEINKKLNKEGLRYRGTIRISHIIEILYRDIGVKRLREEVVRPFKGLKIAVHYGCHILRPKQLVEFDEPGTAATFDELVRTTGAEIIPWPSQKECCGSPMLGIDDDLSYTLTRKKIMSANQAGADYLCVACSYCQLQFDRVQRMMIAKKGENHNLPSVLYTQLLGLSLGIDENTLGIQQNELDISSIMKFL